MFVKKRGFFEETVSDVENASKTENEDNTEEKSVSAELSAEELPSVRVEDGELFERLSAMERLNSELNVARVAALLKNAREMTDSKTFRVGFIGCRGSGRRTMINSIVGREILCGGEFDGHCGKITVVGGSKDGIAIIKNGSPVKSFPLTEEGKRKLGEALRNGSDKQRNAAVEITVKSDFLNKLGISLELCGGGDYSDTEVGFDCAVLTLLAHHLMSVEDKNALALQTERSPRIICAVNHMDLLSDEKDREMIMRYGNGNVKKLAPAAETVYGVAFDTERIKSLLSEYRKNPDHSALKADIIGFGHAAEAGALLSEELKRRLGSLEEQERLSHERIERERGSMDGEMRKFLSGLEAELLKRCERCYKWMSDKKEDWFEDLFESLSIELEHSGNPKDWWESILPYKYKMQMKSLGKTLDSNLGSALAADGEWLNSRIKEKYGVSIDMSLFRLSGSEYRTALDSSEVLDKSGLKDIKNLKLTSRIIAGTAMILGYTLLPSVAIACGGIAVASIGGGFASEMFLNKKLEQQREALKKELYKTLKTDTERRMKDVEGNMTAIYRAMFSEAADILEKNLDERKERLGTGEKNNRTEELKTIYGSELEALNSSAQ